MAGKKLRELGWGPMMDALVWKTQATKKIKEVKESKDDFYDGEGNLLTQFQSNTSTGKGGLKKVDVGYHTMKTYPQNVNVLAKSLIGLSNFTPYGLTDIYDINGNVIFTGLIYDSVVDLASAMLRSEQYPNMFYISHYYYVDQTYKSPRIFAKNLAYWTIVGKPNYTNKRTSTNIGSYFDMNKDKVEQYNAHLSLCTQISLYLMNNHAEWANSGIDGSTISSLSYASQYDTYFSWPHFRMPMYSPLYVQYLYNSPDQTIHSGKGEQFRMRDCNWGVKSIHKIDFAFDNEMREVTYNGSMIWKNPSIREWQPNKTKKSWAINDITKYDTKRKKSEIKNHIEKPEEHFWSYSSIVLFEMTNIGPLNGYESGAYRYFIVKPFGEDFFSMQNSTDLYNEDFVYVSIEEDGKKPELKRVRLSKLVWPHLFDEKSFTEIKGWIGNFSLFQLPLSDWSSKFNKLLRGGQNTENSFKIRFMLSKFGDSSHGYFVQPSDQVLTIEKTKIKGITQIRTKYIGS